MDIIRDILFSDEFESFYRDLDARIREKYDYALNIVRTFRIVNSKFVKKLEASDFYELRVSISSDEYRTIVFTIDNENFMECRRVLLLNSFLKKGTQQYKAEIKSAERILERYKED